MYPIISDLGFLVIVIWVLSKSMVMRYLDLLGLGKQSSYGMV